jgi:hypothetical protein
VVLLLLLVVDVGSDFGVIDVGGGDTVVIGVGDVVFLSVGLLLVLVVMGLVVVFAVVLAVVLVLVALVLACALHPSPAAAKAGSCAKLHAERASNPGRRSPLPLHLLLLLLLLLVLLLVLPLLLLLLFDRANLTHHFQITFTKTPAY